MHFCVVWGDVDHAAMVRLTGRGLDQVIRADEDEFPRQHLAPRRGEVVGIFDLRAWGPDRRDWMRALRAIIKDHGAGVVCIDRESGARGMECWDMAGAQLFHDALENKMRKVSARAMSDLRWRETQRGRMPDDEAKMIWFDQTLTEATALKRMPGWTRPTAMARLKGRRRGAEAEYWSPIAAAHKAKAAAERKPKPETKVRPARGPRLKSKTKRK